MTKEQITEILHSLCTLIEKLKERVDVLKNCEILAVKSFVEEVNKVDINDTDAVQKLQNDKLVDVIELLQIIITLKEILTFKVNVPIAMLKASVDALKNCKIPAVKSFVEEVNKVQKDDRTKTQTLLLNIPKLIKTLEQYSFNQDNNNFTEQQNQQTTKQGKQNTMTKEQGKQDSVIMRRLFRGTLKIDKDKEKTIDVSKQGMEESAETGLEAESVVVIEEQSKPEKTVLEVLKEAYNGSSSSEEFIKKFTADNSDIDEATNAILKKGFESIKGTCGKTFDPKKIESLEKSSDAYNAFKALFALVYNYTIGLIAGQVRSARQDKIEYSAFIKAQKFNTRTELEI